MRQLYCTLSQRPSRYPKYDLVCDGHDHKFKIDLEKHLLNPGALMGYNPLKNMRARTFPRPSQSTTPTTGEALGYQVKTHDGKGMAQVIPYDDPQGD
jgi:hypothetical protein